MNLSAMPRLVYLRAVDHARIAQEAHHVRLERASVMPAAAIPLLLRPLSQLLEDLQLAAWSATIRRGDGDGARLHVGRKRGASLGCDRAGEIAVIGTTRTASV
jgi:hypothetical protein